jgi:hypothetical protein
MFLNLVVMPGGVFYLRLRVGSHSAVVLRKRSNPLSGTLEQNSASRTEDGHSPTADSAAVIVRKAEAGECESRPTNQQ